MQQPIVFPSFLGEPRTGSQFGAPKRMNGREPDPDSAKETAANRVGGPKRTRTGLRRRRHSVRTQIAVELSQTLRIPPIFPFALPSSPSKKDAVLSLCRTAPFFDDSFPLLPGPENAGSPEAPWKDGVRSCGGEERKKRFASVLSWDTLTRHKKAHR